MQKSVARPRAQTTRGDRSRPKARTAELAITGLAAPIEVRRHPSARRMTLRVCQTRRAVVVTMPSRCRLDEAGPFVNRHLDWLRERLGDLPDPIPFADGISIPLRGEQQIVRFIGPERTGSIVRFESGDAGRMEILVKGRFEHAPRRLEDWLIEQARIDLDRQVAVHCKRLGLRAKRLSLRDQASRWGSCSTTGLLSFSWRLILAPPLVLDYVAAHEVAHLAEMNHGPRFWALVARTMPELGEAKAWLHANGLQLHHYGASRERGSRA